MCDQVAVPVWGFAKTQAIRLLRDKMPETAEKSCVI